MNGLKWKGDTNLQYFTMNWIFLKDEFSKTVLTETSKDNVLFKNDLFENHFDDIGNLKFGFIVVACCTCDSLN